jgi:hypothetical protein
MRNRDTTKATIAYKKIYEQRIVTYNLSPILCKQCNKPLSYKKYILKNKFCNHSCAAKHNNKGIRRHGEEKTTCVICGKRLSSTTAKHCKRRECSLIYTINTYGDLSHQPHYRRQMLRLYYILIRGNKCEGCGTETWLDKPVPIVAHHINGDANNWLPENVMLLCGNCHPSTPNYCGKNIGKSTRVRKYHIL